jgi:hypothetical protein
LQPILIEKISEVTEVYFVSEVCLFLFTFSGAKIDGNALDFNQTNRHRSKYERIPDKNQSIRRKIIS